METFDGLLIKRKPPETQLFFYLHYPQMTQTGAD
jgi:hypothetical protein